jgi:hypothetical protein
MTSMQSEIEAAMASVNRLTDIYARLRLNIGSAERTDLLRQADETAENLRGSLTRIAAEKKETQDNTEAASDLNVLGELIESVMVQEREYRLASGAGLEEDDIPDDREKTSL